MPDGFIYNPNASAVPLEVIQNNYNKIKQGRLHPKRPGQSVRREMTERRISNNIMLYNSAIVKPNEQDLFIGQKQNLDYFPTDLVSTAGPTSIGQSESRDHLRFRYRNNSL